jgi:hypothetical protein
VELISGTRKKIDSFMSYSKSMAVRFAMDLSGVALGMLEAARLLSEKTSREEGLGKLNRIRTRLASFEARPFLGDSLSIFLKEKFEPRVYLEILDRLEKEGPNNIMPEIRALADKTSTYLNESRRTEADLLRAF